MTHSCQQCILERDGTGCAEDTLQGLLACGGQWVGPMGMGVPCSLEHRAEAATQRKTE